MKLVFCEAVILISITFSNINFKISFLRKRKQSMFAIQATDFKQKHQNFFYK